MFCLLTPDSSTSIYKLLELVLFPLPVSLIFRIFYFLFLFFYFFIFIFFLFFYFLFFLFLFFYFYFLSVFLGDFQFFVYSFRFYPLICFNNFSSSLPSSFSSSLPYSSLLNFVYLFHTTCSHPSIFLLFICLF